MKKTILLTSVCLSLGLAAFAPFALRNTNNALVCNLEKTIGNNIYGTVIDQTTGTPLADVEVQIYLIDSDKPHSTKTDKDGVFRFNVDKKRVARIVVNHEGYAVLENTDKLYSDYVLALSPIGSETASTNDTSKNIVKTPKKPIKETSDVFVNGVLWDGKTNFYAFYASDGVSYHYDLEDESMDSPTPSRSAETTTVEARSGKASSSDVKLVDKVSAEAKAEAKKSVAGAEKRRQGSNMTAGERNDLEKWEEWKKTAKNEGEAYLTKWGFDMERIMAGNGSTYNLPIQKRNNVEIALVVDATGSMGDEIEFLKLELYDMLDRVQRLGSGLDVRVGSVFYQDHGDSYVTLTKGFTRDAKDMDEFIGKQQAGGGGDFPEAVEDALDEALTRLKWSSNNTDTEKILFLVLDAPPHEEQNNIAKYKKALEKAAQMNIRIIPVTASGIDKNTEFLMRGTAIVTGGTYVFITDHSGIGNAHLQASVSDFKVEFLNDLMVRLVSKYTAQPENKEVLGK